MLSYLINILNFILIALMVHVCSLNLSLTDQSCINDVLPYKHFKLYPHCIDGSRVLPQSVFTDQSCINGVLPYKHFKPYPGPVVPLAMFLQPSLRQSHLDLAQPRSPCELQQLTVLTDQGDISKVVVVSQVFKSSTLPLILVEHFI